MEHVNALYHGPCRNPHQMRADINPRHFFLVIASGTCAEKLTFQQSILIPSTLIAPWRICGPISGLFFERLITTVVGLWCAVDRSRVFRGLFTWDDPSKELPVSPASILTVLVISPFSFH